MKQSIIFLILVLFLLACNNNQQSSSNPDQTITLNPQDLASRIKYHPGDPFIKTLKESEFFEVSGLKDEIIETANGTVLSIPKAAFKDGDGNIVEERIRIEISDIAALEDQIQSNITGNGTTQPISTASTLYINATKDGKDLLLNQNNPIYVETPLNTSPKDLMLFQGIRNAQGEMQWLNPSKPKQYLVPVDLEALDFLPEGFAIAVEQGMPYRNYKQATKKLIDSLYYSFDVLQSDHSSISNSINNSYLNHLNQDTSFNQQPPDEPMDQIDTCTYILPSAIKVIKGKKFEQTFIATKAFEKRMRYLHQSKQQAALEIYVKNLDLDVAECDQAVANLLGNKHPVQAQFLAFAQENLGNLKDLPPSVKHLGAYYSRQLKKTQEELAQVQKKYQSLLQKKDQAAQKVRVEYQVLLRKRLKYRMDKFGFKLQKQGWMSLGKAIEALPKFTLDIQVQNGSDYDRVYVYTIDKRINSIFAFTSADQEHFNQVYYDDPYLIYLSNQMAKVMAVAYKGEQVFYALQDFKVKKVIEIKLNPQLSSLKAFKKMLKKLEAGHQPFNKIWVDLDYQEKFYKEQLRQEQLQRERTFMNRLRPIAIPCGLLSQEEPTGQ